MRIQPDERTEVQTVVDARTLSRLRWRCRRGLLENDLIIERFFSRHEATLTEPQVHGLEVLMELPDNDLLNLLLARSEPEGDLARPDVVETLRLMRVTQTSTGSRPIAEPAARAT